MISLVGLSPTLLMWLAGAGFAFLSLMYLLRLRRRRVVVPYLPLWQKVVKQNQYQSLWQRLKRLFSWLIQLLLLFILLFALGDPHLRAELFSGRHLVVVIDTSASMQATDLGKSRLAVAKQKAEKLIDGLIGADQMMIVQMDAEIVPLTPFTSDKKQLKKQLKTMISSETSADLRRALLLAKDALQGHKRGEIIVLSDAALGASYKPLLVPEKKKNKSENIVKDKQTKPKSRSLDKPNSDPTQKHSKKSKKDTPKKQKHAKKDRKRRKKRKKTRRRRRRHRKSKRRRRKKKRWKLPAGLKKKIDTKLFSKVSHVHRKLPRFRLIRIGKGHNNVGIVALSARRLTNHPMQFSVYTELRNFGEKPVSGLLEFYVDKLIVETIRVKLKAKEHWRHILPRLTAQGQRLEARLKIDKGIDLLPADNRAYAVLPKAEPISVLLVSSDNLYLQAALLSDVQLIFRHIPCGQDLPQKPYDVVIYNQCAPKEEPLSGRFLFIAPPAKHTPFRLKMRRGNPRMIKSPLITDLIRQHPVLRFVALRDLNIARSVAFKMRSGDRAIASSFGKPVFLARETKNLRALAVGFALQDTDMTLRMAFPLFLKNTMQWLMRGGRPLPPTARKTGNIWHIPLSDSVQKVTIQNPKGTKIELPVHNAAALFGGKYGGFYQLAFDGGKRLIAANLSDPEESQIEPRTIKPQWLKTVKEQRAKDHESGLVVLGIRLPIPKPMWLYLLLFVLILFGIEWFTYNRRITV